MRPRNLGELVKHQDEPGLLIKLDEALAIAEERGSKAISDPSPYEPDQCLWKLYVGIAGPKAKETPHIHLTQVEAYVPQAGVLRVECKRRWETSWQTRVAAPGDLLIITQEVCHFVRWESSTGVCWVFKAPQIAGVGRGMGKVTCTNGCPHYGQGCVLPRDFAEQLRKAA